MMKRKTFKLDAGRLGAGLISLMTVSAGCSSQALAQALESQPTGKVALTATELSFDLAMAQAAAQTPSTQGNAAPGPTSGRKRVAIAPATATSGAKPTADNAPIDGLSDGGAYIEADHIESSDENGVHAFGHVEMRYKGKTIRADDVTHNPDTGITVASGHTQTISDTGAVQFADTIRFDDDMQTGVSENFASIGNGNGKVFARRLEQIDANTNQFTNVIYTPCELCVSHGKTQPPSWSIEASTITQRKDQKMVYYNNALVKLHGIPVFYSPYLWTPDPELDRASGLLQPKIGFTKKRGFSYEQPYLWSISPYQSLIISPQFNASVNPLVNFDYERQFYSGLLHARFGFTDEAFFDNKANRIGNAEARDYLLADGHFKIDDNWRWSFSAQHVNDEVSSGNTYAGRTYANFFERYNIENAFNQVGDLTVDSRDLINQFNITRQVSNAYVSLTMANFQSLQLSGYADPISTPQTGLQPITLNADYFPVIAPQIEAYWSPDVRLLGGQLTVSANALGLQHKLLAPDFTGAPTAASGTTGFDTARVSAGAAWYGDMTTQGGIKWGPFVDMRHDYYHETNLNSAGASGSYSRDLGTAGLNLSYPLYKKFNGLIAIIEPTAQFAVSPKSQTNPYLPTEDSQSVEFDSTTLFTVNRSQGFDIYEAGSRLNLGIRTDLKFDSGLNINGLFGRILRDKPETQFLKYVTINNVNYAYDYSGIGSKNSDWILNGDFDTSKGLYGYARLRLDSETLRVSSGEYGLSIAHAQTSATIRYIFNDLLTTPSQVVNGKLKIFGDNYRDLQLYGQHFFNKNWGVATRLDRDEVANTWRRSTVSLIYRDDCIWYEIIYQRNDTALTTANGKPQSSLLFRLNVATLGTSSAKPTDVR